MVQIIQGKPSAGAKFGRAFNPAFQESLNRFLGEQKQKENLEAEDLALQRLGIDIKGVQNPKLRETFLEESIKNKTSPAEYEAEAANLDAIKSKFGDAFADVWKASPIGGRTELMKNAIEASKRGIDIKNLFSQMPSQTQEKKSIEQLHKKEGEFPEYQLDTKGMIPSEVIKYKKELRSFNEPILKESTNKVRSIDTQLNSIKDLKKLNESDKLPKGLSRIFINPKSGQLRPWAQIAELVPPEAELYTKIINDFTTQAKDSYGSRVTNFDLDQFMKRLPNLSNSKEGRDLIIKRMEGIERAERVYHDNLKKVYRKYGAGNITPEDAEALSEEMSEEEVSRLRDEAISIDEGLSSLSGEQENESAPEGRILVELNGKRGHVPKEQAELVVQRGGKIL